MAEFQMKSLEGDGGGSSSLPIKKKKFKLNKRNIIIVGGLGIVAFFFIMALTRKSESVGEPVAGGSIEDMTSNTADVAAQLQNYNDNMNSALQSQISQLESAVNQNNNDVLNTFTGVLGETAKGYEEKLSEYNEKFNSLQSSNKESMDAITQRLVDQEAKAAKELEAAKKKAAADLAAYKKEDTAASKKAAEAAQKKIDAANKKAAEAKAAAQKALNKTVAKPKATTTKKTSTSGLNTKTSVVDFLKSQGKDSSFTARKTIAAKQGIKNYTGTAAQNTKMLANLKKPAAKKPAAKKPAAKKK